MSNRDELPAGHPYRLQQLKDAARELCAAKDQYSQLLPEMAAVWAAIESVARPIKDKAAPKDTK